MSRKRSVVHVAPVEITEETGMGRVAWHWREAFARRGYEFVHVGPREVGPLRHPAFFPRAARRVLEGAGARPDLLLVHEPAASAFVKGDAPVVAFSHGIERRAWEVLAASGASGPIPLRSRLLFPLWRLRPCDAGLARADLVLAINEEDRRFVHERYRRDARSVRVFRNGVHRTALSETDRPRGEVVGLFLGSWLMRKGIGTLVSAATHLHDRGEKVRWLLAGTGAPESVVRGAWPQRLQDRIEVLPRFRPEDEAAILARASFCVLPSFFEGQPLALLQAMEAGRCCITTNCCGQKDIVKDGETGLLHAPGDAAQLADLVVECARDEARRLEIGRRARAAMADRPWSVVADEVVGIVESALEMR